MQTATPPRAGVARTVRIARLALGALAVLGSGCGDAGTAPDAGAPAQARAARPARAAAVAAWDEIARGVIIRQRPSPPASFRLLAYVSLAQYAALAADDGRDGPPAFLQGAVAGASAATLAHLYPVEAPTLDAHVDAQTPAPPGQRRHFARGEALGRRAAARVIARASTDRFSTPFTGPVPTGDGLWFSSATPPAAPLLPLFGQVRPFFLPSGSALRPAAPPAFGSPAYVRALDEVRRIAQTRTGAQDSIAKFWAFPAGTVLPGGYWNQIALALVAEHRLGEERTARLLTLMHGAMLDAVIAAHDAKYTYWLIRPSQADRTITLAIGLPNHPSYPSNHSAASAAAAGVLSAFFPGERERLEALAVEAGLSRLYGGIHYRFDIDVGQQLGYAAADAALAFDAREDLLSLLP